MGCSVGLGLGFSRSDMVHLLLQSLALFLMKLSKKEPSQILAQFCHTGVTLRAGKMQLEAISQHQTALQ
jgi:hypothetical protein